MTMSRARLGLGAAQLGMPYGIANRSGAPDDAEAARLLAAARRNGIAFFDTAQGYGRSEELLGRFLGGDTDARFATKLALGPQATTPAETRIEVEAAVDRSCQRLGRDRLDVVFLHRFADLLVAGGAVVAALDSCRAAGRVGSIGVSVYDVAEAQAALADGRIRALELPLNALDDRFAAAGILQDAKRRGVQVVARSVYLQGLLLLPPDNLPKAFSAARPTILAVQDVARAHGLAPAEMLLRHGLGADVDIVLVGAETAAQVEQNAAFAAKGPLPGTIRTDLRRAASLAPAWLIDPRAWPPR